MNPNSTIETARAWLANPENARDRDYQRLATSLVSAEMAIERVADTMGRMGVIAANNSSPRAAGIAPSATSEDQLAAEILATAAPVLAQRQTEAKTATVGTDAEASMAASILATAGITPRSAQAAHGAAFGSSADPDQARQPVSVSAAKLEASAIRDYLSSPESVALSDVSRRQYEQRLSELEGI